MERRFKTAYEPALQQRIAETLRNLPLGIKKKHLKAFAADCAQKRNDISHFGGQRHPADYRTFVIDVAKKSEALAYLYHVLLLQEIGVDQEILRYRVFDGRKSHLIKYTLNEVGLLPPDQAAPPAGAGPVQV